MRYVIPTLMLAAMLTALAAAEPRRIMECFDRSADGWIKSYFLYGDAMECLAEAAGQVRGDFYDISALESLSGIRLDRSGEIDTVCYRGSERCYTWTGNEHFIHVNPEFVTWVRRVFVHEPESPLHDMAKSIYRNHHKAAVRRAALSYRYLKTKGLGQESENYRRAMDENRDMLAYLVETYGEDRAYEEALDMGFWLRRTIDGSAPAIHEAMTDMIRVYDREWYDANF